MNRLYIYGGIDMKEPDLDASVIYEIDPFHSYPQWRQIKLHDKMRIIPGIHINVFIVW
jgi:hypothetical protein